MLSNEAVREILGKRVREVWVRWASQQANPKPSWLVPWEQLSEPEREVDRQIGEELWGFGMDCAVAVCQGEAEEERIYTPGEQGKWFAVPKELCAAAISKFRTTGMLDRLGGSYAGVERKIRNPLLDER